MVFVACRNVPSLPGLQGPERKAVLSTERSDETAV